MRILNWPRLSGLLAACAIMAGILAQAPSALGQQAEPNRIRVAYDEPKDRQHAPIMQAFRDGGHLEKIQKLLSPFRLPRPLTFRTAGCDGEINAWFEVDTVTICYEYIAYVSETAASSRRPAWVNEQSVIAGAMLDVFLHEGAHALFDYLDIPLLGREEDAADQLAAYMLLGLGRKDTPQLIAGIVYMYLNEAGVRRLASLHRKRLRFVDGKQHSDVHSTPLQRMYNTLCLAYGAQPELFKHAVERGALPADRADGCAEEFGQVEKAFRRLILPHVDQDVLKQVLATDSLSLGR
ncbi:MAG: DUF4344 domain-containing metallopeptidase [Bosea sp. (in: a-proteobacteria)]